MNLNDPELELQVQIRIIDRAQAQINLLLRDGRSGELEDCLSMIEFAARDARRRVREMRQEEICASL